MDTFTYNLAIVILTGVSAAGLVGTLTVYYFQLRATHKLATLPILIQYLESPQVREARRLLREAYEGKRPYRDWTAEETAAAAEVCAAYDLTATLVRSRRAHRRVVFRHWGDSIKSNVKICSEFICDRQKGRPSYFRDLLWVEGKINRWLRKLEKKKADKP